MTSTNVFTESPHGGTKIKRLTGQLTDLGQSGGTASVSPLSGPLQILKAIRFLVLRQYRLSTKTGRSDGAACRVIRAYDLNVPAIQ
ncbi:MAG TPA: hypothetical protein EYQ63_04070 [Fuerstia sp.]|nr:hypothetical protein [Fuerstiella sp.]